MPTAIILLEDGFEDQGLIYPLHRLKEAGFDVVLAGEHEGERKHGKHGVPMTVQKELAKITTDDHDVLVIPGGRAPDTMRTRPVFVKSVRDAFEAGKPVAVICHGPRLLIEAGVVKGRTLACWPSVRTDHRNAGAEVKDEEAVVDGTLVSARRPGDLAAWMHAFLEVVKDKARIEITV